MTIDTETMNTLNLIKSDVQDMQGAVQMLDDLITGVETSVVVPESIDFAFSDISIGLNTILTWVQQAIDDGSVEEPVVTAMNQFLSELKAVFDKYSAKIKRLDPAAYGQSYGGASVFRFSIVEPGTNIGDSKDIVVQTADIIAASDLVA